MDSVFAERISEAQEKELLKCYYQEATELHRAQPQTYYTHSSDVKGLEQFVKQHIEIQLPIIAFYRNKDIPLNAIIWTNRNTKFEGCMADMIIRLCGLFQSVTVLQNDICYNVEGLTLLGEQVYKELKSSNALNKYESLIGEECPLLKRGKHSFIRYYEAEQHLFEEDCYTDYLCQALQTHNVVPLYINGFTSDALLKNKSFQNLLHKFKQIIVLFFEEQASCGYLTNLSSKI